MCLKRLKYRGQMVPAISSTKWKIEPYRNIAKFILDILIIENSEKVVAVAQLETYYCYKCPS